MKQKLLNKKIIIILILLIILICGVIIIKKHNNFSPSIENTNVLDEPTLGKEKIIIDMNNKKNVSIKDNIKTNISKKLDENHYITNSSGKENKKIVVNNIKLYANKEKEATYFSANITNNSNKDIDELLMFFDFYRTKKSDFIFYSADVAIYNLKKGETQKIEFSSFEDDFSNAYDLKILY